MYVQFKKGALMKQILNNLQNTFFKGKILISAGIITVTAIMSPFVYQNIQHNYAGGTVKASCFFEVAGVCYTKPIFPTPMTKSECIQAMQNKKLGIKSCGADPDYWAGAVLHCHGVKNMPTPEQLTILASDLYGDKNFRTGDYEFIDNLAMKDSKYASDIKSMYKDIYNVQNSFSIWSGKESDGFYAYGREFRTNFTYAGVDNSRSRDKILAICVQN